MVLLAIARFELWKRFRMLSTWIYFGLFFAAAVFMMLASGGAFESVTVGMGADKVFANSPFSVHNLIAALTWIAVLVTAPVFGQAVHQDLESGSHPLFFTKPIRRGTYLWGRFLGALLVMAFILASVPLGLWLGSLAPFLERSLFEPSHLSTWLWPYLIMAIPNLLAIGAIFFALATLGKRMMPVYVGAVLLFIGYNLGLSMMVKLDARTLAGMLDPFGLLSADLVTEYWTVAEKNARLIPLEGMLLANRALWLSIGAGLVGLTWARFRFSVDAGSLRKGKRALVAAALEPANAPLAPLPVVHTLPARGLALVSLVSSSFRLNFLEIVRSVYFAVLVLAGMLFIVQVDKFGGELFGTRTWPVTGHVIVAAAGAFSLIIAIIITIYSGELVWRERDVGLDQLLDATPIPTWVPFLGKLFALMAVQVVLLAAVMVAGLCVQTFHGYHHYELGLYVRDLFGLRLIDFLLLCVLAMTVQSVVQHKYVGHAVMVAYFMSPLLLNRLGLENSLYRFGDNPGFTHSDMNGFGPFLKPLFWFDFYWALLCVGMAILSSLLWARGTDGSLKVRLALAGQPSAPPPRW